MLAKSANAILGSIPLAGPLISGLVTEVIPNQRLDRVAVFLQFIQGCISEDDLKRLSGLPDRVALLEEGMLAVGLTPQTERLERIANVVVFGLNNKEIETDKISKILHAVRNISDFDAIVLKNCQLFGKDFQASKLAFSFQKKHPKIWPPSTGIHPFSSCDEEQEKMNVYYKEADICRERVNLSERYLSSLSLLKLHLGNHYIEENNIKSVKDALEGLTASFENEEYCITDFGIEVVEAMEKS